MIHRFLSIWIVQFDNIFPCKSANCKAYLVIATIFQFNFETINDELAMVCLNFNLWIFVAAVLFLLLVNYLNLKVRFICYFISKIHLAFIPVFVYTKMAINFMYYIFWYFEIVLRLLFIHSHCIEMVRS